MENVEDFTYIAAEEQRRSDELLLVSTLEVGRVFAFGNWIMRNRTSNEQSIEICTD